MKKEKEPIDADVVFEPSDGEGMEEHSDKKQKKLREELKLCQKERQEYLDGWQRTRADMVNAKKDFERQRAEIGQYIKEEIFHEILPVADSFYMAMKGSGWQNVDENWRKGVEYINQQLVSILENNGLLEIKADGMGFDPNEHASVESVQVKTELDDGKVIDVVQKGYRLNGKVIRPAKVKVGKFEK